MNRSLIQDNNKFHDDLSEITRKWIILWDRALCRTKHWRFCGIDPFASDQFCWNSFFLWKLFIKPQVRPYGHILTKKVFFFNFVGYTFLSNDGRTTIWYPDDTTPSANVRYHTPVSARIPWNCLPTYGWVANRQCFIQMLPILWTVRSYVCKQQ